MEEESPTFPDEYRKTLAGLITWRIAALRANQRAEAAKLEALLERVRHPRFGLCERCGAVMSFARMARDVALTLCAQCE